VRNLVGRFLEHSRIFYFANGGEGEVYIGSADWMSRNLNRRVEIVCPVNDSKLRQYLKDEVLQLICATTLTRVICSPTALTHACQPARMKSALTARCILKARWFRHLNR